MDRRAAAACTAFFLILCSYYLLRPVRDEMGVRSGAGRMQWLFTLTFAATIILVPLFGWLAKRLPRGALLPLAYGFIALNLAGFALWFRSDESSLVTAVSFFVWLSVINLFVISLFWSATGDLFRFSEAQRLYGFIAAGGTAGALSGPALAALLARALPASALLMIAAALLLLAVVCVMVMRRGLVAPSADEPPLHQAMGGSTLAGIWLTLRSPTLLSMALLIICYTTVSTFLYIEQADRVAAQMSDSGERTAFFATIDLCVNALALGVQLFATSRIASGLGLTGMLSIVPLLVIGGLLLLAGFPAPLSVAAVQIVHRAGDFSLMRPGREMIYTALDPESRYKGKNFIDTAVYRSNDAASAWLISAVRGAGLGAAVATAVGAALLWLATGFLLGRRHDRIQQA